MRTSKWSLAGALVGALAISAAAQAQVNKPGPGPGPGYGPGYGQGMMGGCPGWGGGPGYGMGPGMMGGYGGYGMGPGMMGGYGVGPGMHYGYNLLGGLNLNDQQRKEVSKIIDDQQKRQYELMGQGMELRSKLRDLYSQEKWDAGAIGGVYDQLGKLQSQMVRSRIEARNRIYNVLTPEQRQQYRSLGDPVD